LRGNYAANYAVTAWQYLRLLCGKVAVTQNVVCRDFAAQRSSRDFFGSFAEHFSWQYSRQTDIPIVVFERFY
jgi:anti-sigma regulatory factor (Ser/Thr protein kinase)